MASTLVDPLNIQASQVEAVWTVSRPGNKKGGQTLINRLEAICKAEAARLGYDKVIIRSIPHATTTHPGQAGFVLDAMHVTVRFISKYFSTPTSECGRSAHIPVNIYDPATKTWTGFRTKGKDRGTDYPYNNLAMQGNPKHSHTALNENPFPKVMRQNGIDRPSRDSITPAPQSRPGSSGGTVRRTPTCPQSRPGTSHSNRGS